MLIAILIIGVLFFGLIVKLAEGALKIVLILVLLVILAISGFFSSNSNSDMPSSALEIPHVHGEA